MINIKKNIKGMSIIEVMIATAITVIVMGTILSMMISFKWRFEEGTIIASMESETRNSIDNIVRDIQIADSIVTTYGGYSSSDDTIVIKMNSIDANNDLLDFGNAHDYIIYRPDPTDSTILQMITDAYAKSSRVSGTQEIMHSLSSITFTYDDAVYEDTAFITIAITASNTVKGLAKTAELTSNARIRNK